LRGVLAGFGEVEGDVVERDEFEPGGLESDDLGVLGVLDKDPEQRPCGMAVVRPFQSTRDMWWVLLRRVVFCTFVPLSLLLLLLLL